MSAEGSDQPAAAAHQLALKAARREEGGQEDSEQPPRRRADPVSELAALAGYDDPERWWERYARAARAWRLL